MSSWLWSTHCNKLEVPLLNDFIEKWFLILDNCRNRLWFKLDDDTDISVHSSPRIIIFKTNSVFFKTNPVLYITLLLLPNTQWYKWHKRRLKYSINYLRGQWHILTAATQLLSVLIRNVSTFSSKYRLTYRKRFVEAFGYRTSPILIIAINAVTLYE